MPSSKTYISLEKEYSASDLYYDLFASKGKENASELHVGLFVLLTVMHPGQDAVH